MRYAAFEHMIRPGRAKPELWRLALGILAIALIAGGLTQAVFSLARLSLSQEAYLELIAGFGGGSASAPATLATLLMLAPLAIGAMLMAALLHDRSALSLFGPLAPMTRQFLRVTGALIALNLVIVGLPPWSLPADISRAMPLGTWLTLLPVTILALIVQCGAEEVFFRGYVQTQLAARGVPTAVWLVLPSALFAMGHYSPEVYSGNAWMVVGWAFCFGLATADLTARAGTLGPALALHVVNNAVAVALVAPKGPLSGLALFRMDYSYEDEALVAQSMPLELGVLGLSWLAARVMLRR